MTNLMSKKTNMFNVEELRKDFPILANPVEGKKLYYLDSAATSQKPVQVIEAITHYYQNLNANVHRGIHTLSEQATAAYESVRELVRALIDAPEAREIIYTLNTTASINFVALSWGRTNVLPGDEIVLTPMEHHSNLVPWQLLAAERQAKLVFLEMTEDGQIDMASAERLIGDRTRIVAVTQMSNVYGSISPVKELAKLAHARGAVILVDGAQGVPHLPSSVREMDCDFYCFSLHKMLGPTGVGILWGRAHLLEAMPPVFGGGDMISTVYRDRSTWNELPWKFEAGTPNIADVIASAEAIKYLNKLGMENVREHEIEISKYALAKFEQAENITLYGPRDVTKRGAVFSFNLKDIHPHDIGQILSEQGVAVRAGHHCCQPLMRDLNVSGTARASFYIYNTKEEIDFLFESLKEAEKVLGHVAFR
jgi:cysteine desulfurase/selenocysteine lyase